MTETSSSPTPSTSETPTPPEKRGFKERFKQFFWPVIGVLAVSWSVRLLYIKLEKEVSGDPAVARALAQGGLWSDLQIIINVIGSKLSAIPAQGYILAGLSTLLAYAALAWYDRISLLHLNRHQNISWLYIAMCSFTTYALSHNIGASVVSGGMVRFRAYSAKGLSPGEIAILVGLCSFTFVFGTIVLFGIVLVLKPDIVAPLVSLSPHFAIGESVARLIGFLLLGATILYTVGSWRHFKPLKIGSFEIVYPRFPVAIRQFFVAPLEIVGAVGIIYFVLPAQGHPGFLIVLGAFLFSFSAGLISQVPGGVGVMEAVFLALMPKVPASSVFAALLIWRLFYLIIPLALSIPVVLLFEHSQLGKQTKGLAPPPA